MMIKLLHGILIGSAAAAIALALHFGGVLNRPESWTWIPRVEHFAAPGAATDDIVLIEIDEQSIQWAVGKNEMYSWPWPRDLHALMVEFCRRGGARVVAYDLLFPTPHALGGDAEFGAAIKAGGRFVAAMQVSPGAGRSRELPAAVRAKMPAVAGLEEYLDGSVLRAVGMETATPPIPAVADNATAIGHVRDAPVRNPMIFRDVPFVLFGDKFVPSLGLATFLTANPEAAVSFVGGNLVVGDRVVPLDRQGRATLRFRGPTHTHKSYPAQLIINSQLQLMEGKTPQLEPAALKDKYVIVGYSGDANADLWRTPVGQLVGHETHATFLDNLLSGDLIRNASGTGVVLLTLVLALAAGIAGRFSQKGWQILALAAVSLPLPVVFGCIAYQQNVWLPVVVQEVGVFLSIAGAVVVSYAVEGRQKRYIKSAFSQYLSAEVIERLIRDPDSLTLGGETRELSIFFSDIQGFTSISEQLTPAALTDLLNEYLTEMTDIIYQERGTIDKYEGDAIIAFWNAPLDDPDHVVHAVRAGLRCGKRLAELRPRFRTITGRDVYARIGIHTGDVTIGNMGSQQRFNYTFLGDAGNLASRLEGVNKQFGTYFMISQATKERLTGEFKCRELGRVRVVGRQEPVVVFEPMFKEDYDNNVCMVNFDEALRRYYQGDFDGALELFSAMAADDPPSMAYCRLCRKYQQDPPVDGWAGIYEMTEK